MFSLPVDAIYIGSVSNLFYFSGYSNADARILLTPNRFYYVSDARVKEEVREKLPQFTFVDVERGDCVGAALKLMKELHLTAVGYEDETISHKEFTRLSGVPVEWVSAEEMLWEARASKTAEEIETICAAQKITDQVYANILDNFRVGITEREVAARMNSQIYAMGAELAFDTIVAFGENTSKPHAHPSDRALKMGDAITLDFGAKFEGYCSDMTRSLSFGKPSEEYKQIYRYVLDAQEIALEGIHAGMTGVECDALAREYFKMNGISEYFIHSLGHSLGIDIHENPTFSPRNNQKIPDNAVLSVEPGLYLPKKFGVRIEDIVIVKNNGVENLTKSEKQLIIL